MPTTAGCTTCSVNGVSQTKPVNYYRLLNILQSQRFATCSETGFVKDRTDHQYFLSKNTDIQQLIHAPQSSKFE